MSYIKSALKWLLKVIQTTQGIICTIGLVTTTFLIFAQVVNRYWLHFEIMWLSDLALYIFIFFMFVAAAITTWREGHVAVDFFRDRVTKNKPIATAIYHVFLVVLSIAVLSIFLPITYQFMLRAMKYPEYGTLARFFNESWLQITLFFAMAFVMLHLLIIARKDIAELIRNLLLRSGRR